MTSQGHSYSYEKNKNGIINVLLSTKGRDNKVYIKVTERWYSFGFYFDAEAYDLESEYIFHHRKEKLENHILPDSVLSLDMYFKSGYCFFCPGLL